MKAKEESEKVGLKLNIQKIKIVASDPITSWQIDGKKWKQWQILFSWAPKSLQMMTVAVKWKVTCSLEESYDKHRQHVKKQRHYFADKGPYSQGLIFPVVMYECENWTIKKAEHQRIGAFELWCWRRPLRAPWTARRSTVNPTGNKPWIFIRRTDVEAETPILWPPDVKNWLIRKDPDAGKDWMQEKRTTDYKTVGWHLQFNGHESE